MAPVYSVQMCSQTISDGEEAILVPPADYIWIVRDVDVYCRIRGLSNGVLHFIDLATGKTWWYFSKSASDVDPSGTGQWRGRQVFGADGFGITGFGNDVDVVVSGYQLSP